MLTTQIHRELEPALDALIDQEQIVAIFQGKGEWGTRALGNRSILFDPRDKEAKQIVNNVKMNIESIPGLKCNVRVTMTPQWTRDMIDPEIRGLLGL